MPSASDVGGPAPRRSHRSELPRVGADGFEPSASCAQGKRAAWLRYTPISGAWQGIYRP
jgi:hypothetical protein